MAITALDLIKLLALPFFARGSIKNTAPLTAKQHCNQFSLNQNKELKLLALPFFLKAKEKNPTQGEKKCI